LGDDEDCWGVFSWPGSDDTASGLEFEGLEVEGVLLFCAVVFAAEALVDESLGVLSEGSDLFFAVTTGDFGILEELK
jgi:hypothetical protein